jgi:hypothetical protein
MSRLQADQCYQCLGPVDIAPVLATWDRLQFVAVNQTAPEKGRCNVVLQDKFSPALKDLLGWVGPLLGGSIARVILRQLPALVGIHPHVDEWMPGEANWRRFQLPLISHPDIKMRWPDDGVEVHLEPGFLYEVRFDRLHEVVNPTDTARTHLQIDQIDATI